MQGYLCRYSAQLYNCLIYFGSLMHCKMNESLRSVAKGIKYFLCIYTKEVTFTLWFYEGLYIYLVLIDKKNALI